MLSFPYLSVVAIVMTGQTTIFFIRSVLVAKVSRSGIGDKSAEHTCEYKKEIVSSVVTKESAGSKYCLASNNKMGVLQKLIGLEHGTKAT